MAIEEPNDLSGSVLIELIHKLFEQQAACTPDAIAVCDDLYELSYQQLDAIANQAANLLVARGVEVGDVVGLCMERSVVMVIGLLAILKAGAAYLPLDPNQPSSRRDCICDDAQIDRVFTQEDLTHSNDNGVTLINIEDADTYSPERPELVRKLLPKDLVYVLYTSGTTGHPKGVEVCHRGLSNVIRYRFQSFLHPSDCAVFPVTASLDSDASAGQIFSPLCSGGKLIVAENLFTLAESDHYDEITCIGSTPSVISEFINHFDMPVSLKVLLLGGEIVEKYLCEKIWEQTSVLRLVNLYGPTETTVHSTSALLFERGGVDGAQAAINLPITIGSPIDNTQVYILDKDLNESGEDQSGEIYISGFGLAQGYRNRPALTDEKFKTIYLNGQSVRTYATGDMGVRLENGDIKFIGRIDRQVKIRGNRIELDEIESSILNCHFVKQCAVDVEDIDMQKAIVAYIVFDQSLQTKVQLRELQQYLRQQLPIYMFPQRFAVMDELKLTSNGKIDRRSLANHSKQL